MGKLEGNTADTTKCTGCGEPFVSGSGPYIRHGFAGMYHKRCLPRGPAPDPYRAGLIAGLREAAEWHEAEAEKVQPSWPALASIEVPDAEALAIRRDISGHNRWSAMVFRARITALEEEGEK